MAEAERTEFIKRRAQHVATMMGRRPYAFTPEALTHVKFWLDAFARRVGNNRTGLWSATGSTLKPARARANRPCFRDNNVTVIVGLYSLIETRTPHHAKPRRRGAFPVPRTDGQQYGVPSPSAPTLAKWPRPPPHTPATS